jgi:hypothetical protein
VSVEEKRCQGLSPSRGFRKIKPAKRHFSSDRSSASPPLRLHPRVDGTVATCHNLNNPRSGRLLALSSQHPWDSSPQQNPPCRPCRQNRPYRRNEARIRSPVFPPADLGPVHFTLFACTPCNHRTPCVSGAVKQSCLLHPVPDLCFPSSSTNWPVCAPKAHPRSRRATREPSPATFRRHIGHPDTHILRRRCPLTRPATRANGYLRRWWMLSHTIGCANAVPASSSPGPVPPTFLTPLSTASTSPGLRTACCAAPDPAPASAAASDLLGSVLLSVRI